MSTTKNNGGPAFPFTLPIGQPTELNTGMSMRDYFAAKALQGWLAMYANDQRLTAPPPESAATIAYAYADAMLKAREQ